jgi:catechol 2,3-dioxygenase-like lactoylglutathione lyase family enzyme
MLAIEKVDHVGIRVTDKRKSIAFYQLLGFQLITDVGFEEGHPIIMQHASGDVVNLLGPASGVPEANILMDIDDKHPGITHVSYKVNSIEEAKTFLASAGIQLSGEFEFKGLHAVFIRDPDLNVIELDGYEGDEPDTRLDGEKDDFGGYENHP